MFTIEVAVGGKFEDDLSDVFERVALVTQACFVLADGIIHLLDQAIG